MKIKSLGAHTIFTQGTGFTSLERYFLLNNINTFPDGENLPLLALDE